MTRKAVLSKGTEHAHQVAVFDWAGRMSTAYPELGLLFAITNGAKLPYLGKGKSRWSPEAARLKAEGLRPGVPDIALPVARHGFHALFIEMKVGKNTTSEKQDEWIAALRDQGNRVEVCYGAEAAIHVLAEYLGVRILLNDVGEEIL